MRDDVTEGVRASYDRVAGEYAARVAGELAHKPLDRLLLDGFADRVRDLGPACDLGCGPGHVARHLHDRGVRVSGLDLSPGMVEVARRLNPGIEFAEADMRSLPAADGALGGVAAFYSVIHLPRGEVAAALAEVRRALRPGGLLLLAFHVGDGAVHLDEWWGHPVSVDFAFFGVGEMEGFVLDAGLVLIERTEREPYPDVEHPSRRAYLLAERPRE